MLRLNIQMTLVMLFFYSISTAQVTVNFSANNTSGCGFLQVAFTDLSTSTAGTITSWSWDFEGNTSTVQNPGNVFSSAGKYTICLTAFDDQGNSGQECKTDYINVFANPQPDFSATPASGCAPLHVVFNDLTTPGDGNIVEWIWGVGGTNGVIIDDGSLASIENDYPLSDDYTISLTVKDDNGCTNSLTIDDFIKANEVPEIQVSAPVRSSCQAPFDVTFVNSGQTSGIEYTWDFGNGIIFTGPTPPVITYTQPGSYTVQVTAEDITTGCTSDITLANYVYIDPPVDISASAPEACLNQPITFNDISGVIADSVRWDFGDGNESTQFSPSPQFGSIGCFTVTLTRYVNGCATTGTLANCIQVNPLPDLDYTIDAPVGCSLPHQINPISLSADAVSWEWDLGNGITSTDENPSIDISNFGTYPVKLTVTDANGCSNSIESDTVKLEQLVAEKDFGLLLGCIPLEVTLSENSTSLTPITNWNWEVRSGDGASPPLVLTSTDENPTFTIPDTGIYNVTLEVTNSLGCVDVQVFPFTIMAGMPPVTNFSAGATEICFRDGAQFFDESSSYANGWLWDFGDATYSEEQNPMHNFADTGYFDITLTSFHYGCPNTLTIEDVVRFLPPISKFSKNRYCDQSLRREYFSTSIGADSVYWDFGVLLTDTDTSTQFNPVFTFPGPGIYDVTLISVNEASGCQDTIIVASNITDPLASFSIDNFKGCPPFEASVLNSSESANTYEWSSGSGVVSDSTSPTPLITYNDPGAYSDIQLIVRDVHGCEDTLLLTDTIFVTDVIPDMNPVNFYSCGPATIDFEDLSTSSASDIVDWNWRFGTGEGSFEQNPTYSYNQDGVYHISLEVTDGDGCVDRQVFYDAITISIPVAFFEVSTIGCTKSSLEFNNLSSCQDPTYHWDFGDGNTSDLRNPSHLYAAEGSYDVCLTVADPNGCDSTYCLPVPIVIADPIASFTSDLTSGTCPPLLINFENQSSNATNYQWDFGDNSGSSNQESPPHLYTVPGLYDVSLIAFTVDGCRDTVTLADYISLDGPIGDFDWTLLEDCAPGIVSFTGQSIEDYDFIWDFGNGYIDTTFAVQKDSFVYSYEDFGSFNPKLILANDVGCERILESPDPIVIAGLDFDFFASDTLFCDDPDLLTSFIFIENSSQPITDFTWEFEGATTTTSNTSNPLISYTSPGTYDVMLYMDNGKCRDTLIKEDYIRIGAIPDVDFTVSSTSGCLPHAIDFTDLSSISGSVITDWWWTFGDLDSTKIQSPSYLFDEAGTFDVNLTVTSEIGCQAVKTEVITINPLPEVSIAADNEICIGEETQLIATFISDPTGTTYTWNPNPNMSCTDCLDPTVSPSDTTLYTLRVTDANGCSNTFEYTINVLPFTAPTVDLTPDTSVCYKGVIQLNAYVSGGGNENIIQWNENQDGLNCYEGCMNPVASPLESTTYTVNVTNEFGCETEASVFVEVINDYRPFMGDDQTICIGGAAQLSINYGDDPIWISPIELNCSNCYDPIASPEETMTYVAIVQSENDCPVEDSVTVFVQEPQEIDAGEDAVLCGGQVMFLSGEGDGSATWTPALTLSNGSILNPQASPAETTTYVLMIDDGVCESFDSVRVSVVLKANIFAGDQTICEGDTTQLFVGGLADEFTWYPESGLSENYITDPMAMPEETTTYTVVGTIFGCESDTVEVTVNVDPAPSVNLPPVRSFFPDTEVQIDADPISSGDYVYQWTPAEGLSCSDCPRPVAHPKSSTSYSLFVEDLNTGCTYETTTLLKLRTDCGDDLIYAPNAFSPNNDGINDVFKIYSSTVTEISGMQVFDRWGGIIYETKDMSDGWDGFSKGKLLPDGVYVYYIEAVCPLDGSPIVVQGDISIMK